MIMAARATGKEPCMHDSLCSKNTRESLHSAVCRQHLSLRACISAHMAARKHAQRSGLGQHNLCTAHCNAPWISEDLVCRSA